MCLSFFSIMHPQGWPNYISEMSHHKTEIKLTWHVVLQLNWWDLVCGCHIMSHKIRFAALSVCVFSRTDNFADWLARYSGLSSPHVKVAFQVTVNQWWPFTWQTRFLHFHFKLFAVTLSLYKQFWKRIYLQQCSRVRLECAVVQLAKLPLPWMDPGLNLAYGHSWSHPIFLPLPFCMFSMLYHNQD